MNYYYYYYYYSGIPKGAEDSDIVVEHVIIQFTKLFQSFIKPIPSQTSVWMKQDTAGLAGMLLKRVYCTSESQCLVLCVTLNTVNFKDSDRGERDEEEGEEEEPNPPKPVAPDSMFIFKASNP